MIKQINTVFIYVEDQERSLDFYRNKLGFDIHTDEEMRPGSRWLEVVPPGAQTTLTIAAAKDFDRRPGEGSAAFTLKADDAAMTREELASKGADVTELEEEAWSKFFRVTDPDGHTWLVAE